jgi:hypothetical protein
MPAVADVKDPPMSIVDANDFNLLLDIIATVPCHTEISSLESCVP